MQWLEIEYAGTTYAYDSDTEVTFGRIAMVPIAPENMALHRRFGHLAYRSGRWTLTNIGGALSMQLRDEASRSLATLAPRGRYVLASAVTVINLTAGDKSYELILFQRDIEDDIITADPRDNELSDQTVTFAPRSRHAALRLTPSQRRLVIALCERRLRNPNDTTIPPSGEVAQRLGMNLRKFNKRLDEVCKRFHNAGFGGVYDPGGLATSRRHALVDAALQNGIITEPDLSELDSAPTRPDDD